MDNQTEYVVIMDVESKDMRRKKRENFVPRRRTWLLGDESVKKGGTIAAKRLVLGIGIKNVFLKQQMQFCDRTKGRCRHGETWSWSESDRERESVIERKIR